MKKRILGLALALVMIISLLPLTALAATTPMPKVNIIDPTYTSNTNHYAHSGGITGSNTLYLAFEDVMDTTDPTVRLGNKPVVVNAQPEDNYIKIFYRSSTNTLEVTLKNVTYNRTAADEAFFSCSANTPSSSYNNEYNVLMTLEGTNTFTGNGNGFNFGNKGSLTITGTGSLNMNTIHSGSSKGANLNKTSAGEMIIENVTLDLTNSYTGSATALILNNGQVTISNANVTLHTAKAIGIKTADKYNGNMAANTEGVTITGSTLNITGIDDGAGNITYASTYMIQTNGPLVFNSSNVEIHRGEGNHSPLFKYAPSITGEHTEVKYKTHLKNSWTNYSSLNLTAGDELTTSHDLRHFKLVHEHKFVSASNDCTAAKACACGATEAGTGAHAGVVTDCTKDTMCTNPGCQQVYKAKVADAHEANADDGDCTTAVTCKHCTTVVTAAKEKHADSRTDCAVAGTCTNAGCTHAFAAGQHNPAADDGDCTTDIKCATCGKVATKGQAEHKYTDKNDTTCDNAGCTNTRKIEATENPKTGDNTALVLVATLMVAAAAAFVTTKKFVR